MDCDRFPAACQLGRIADALTGFDADNFISTLLATLVGAGIAAWVSFWLTNRERPQPMWKVESQAHGHLNDDTFTVKVTATNIGDGAAYHPRITVSGTGIVGKRRGVEPAVETGGQVFAWCGAPGSGRVYTDPETLDISDSREVHWPSDASVLVEWHQPPRRNKVRHQRLKIAPPEF